MNSRYSLIIVLTAVAGLACTGPGGEAGPPATDAGNEDRILEETQAGAESYLYVWAGDPDEDDSDFLAVIDAAPDSDQFGAVLSTVPVGRSSGAHHSEHTARRS